MQVNVSVADVVLWNALKFSIAAFGISKALPLSVVSPYAMAKKSAKQVAHYAVNALLIAPQALLPRAMILQKFLTL